MNPAQMLFAAFTAGLALSPAMPAGAAVDAGVNTQYVGSVVATTEEIPQVGGELHGCENLTGKCTYAGVTTTDGRIQFVFGGTAISYSRSASQPMATQVNCRLISPHQPGVPDSPGTFVQSTSTALAGAVAATVPQLTAELPLRPVRICVSGLAVFGPVVPAENPKFLTETCNPQPLELP